MSLPSTVSVRGDHLKNVTGIVLAGTYSWDGSAFQALRPRPLLPVAGKPLIEHVLDWLEQAGVDDVIICANCSTAPVRRYLESVPRRACTIGYYEDATPRGAAGCAKDAAAAARADTLVVTDCTSIPAVDLIEAVAYHRRRDAAVTIVVQQRRLGTTDQLYAHPTGTYVLQRQVLDAVPARSFQDIKESLIPRLYATGQQIEVFAARDVSPHVLDANSYLALNQWTINQMWAASVTPANPEGQWLFADPSAVVADDALIVGPVVLGPGVRVDSRAIIVGPSAVGAGSTIGSRAVLARSITWERCSIGEHAVVDQALLTEGVSVEPSAKLARVLKRNQQRRPVRRPPMAGVAAPRLEPAIPRAWFSWQAARAVQLWRLFQ